MAAASDSARYPMQTLHSLLPSVRPLESRAMARSATLISSAKRPCSERISMARKYARGSRGYRASSVRLSASARAWSPVCSARYESRFSRSKSVARCRCVKYAWSRARALSTVHAPATRSLAHSVVHATTNLDSCIERSASVQSSNERAPPVYTPSRKGPVYNSTTFFASPAVDAATSAFASTESCTDADADNMTLFDRCGIDSGPSS